jgi:hypothetical protein
MSVSARKNLRVCEIIDSAGVTHDLLIAIDTLDEVDGILADWATDNLAAGITLSLPTGLISNKDISEVITSLSIDEYAYLQSLATSYDKIVTSNLILPKTSGKGIKIDVDVPTFGWKDLLGNVITDPQGADAPNLTVFRGGSVREYLYAVNDKADLRFHIPHDYVPGSDIYLHVHWAHNGTGISGSLVCTLLHSYSKGHNQANYSAEKTILLSVSTPDITTIPQYRHRIDEIQLSAASPSGSQIDSDDLEPDGIILLNLEVTTLPTVTGGSSGVFIHYIDMHYQSTQLATKQKAPNFYV